MTHNDAEALSTNMFALMEHYQNMLTHLCPSVPSTQFFILPAQAFLNGDWPFLNTLLGMKNASATHPCPICIVSHNDYLRAPRYRKPGDKHSLHPDEPALLTINSDRIIPTPLHLFLGISNRIILDAFSELLGKELVEQSLQQVTTIHSASCGGRSDVFQLNGPQIRKWIKQKCCTTLLAAAADVGDVDAATKAAHSILCRWLHSLHDHLLHKRESEAKEIEDWRSSR